MHATPLRATPAPPVPRGGRRPTARQHPLRRGARGLEPAPGAAGRPGGVRRALPLALAALSTAGCNSGLAALVGLGTEDSTQNAPASLSAFSVEGAAQAPATVRFRVTDADGDAAAVTLFYMLPDEAPTPMTQLGGTPNPGTFAGSPQGAEHALAWDFAAEPGLPADGRFVDGVTVYGTVGGGSQELAPGANATVVGLGNDAPEVTHSEVPLEETAGVVPVSLVVADSSGDLVDLRVEYDLLNDTPDAGWRLARPSLSDGTPEYAIVDLLTDPEGVEAAFFWDTRVDLPDGEDDVRLRFTPVDPSVTGPTALTDVFRVDNNAAPFASIDDVALGASDDVYGGVPIPFTVSDPEADALEVVLQWRRPTEPFVDVSSFTGPELVALAQDPAARATYRICTEVERWRTGRLTPAGPDAVRLTNIAREGSTLLGNGLAGRELEVLRPTLPLRPLSEGWSSAAVSAPVGVVVLDAGAAALVLDASGGAGWRLRELELTPGTVRRAIATGSGAPTALALDRVGATAFVASVDGAGWRLDRVDLASGASLGSANVPTSGPPRGVAALASTVALLTVDDTVLRVAFADGGPSVQPLFTGLAEPWGVLVDPFDPERALVAERASDRVLALDLRLRAARALPVVPLPGEAGPALPAPSTLAYERGGSALLIVVEDAAAGRQLALLPLGAAQDHDDDGVEDPVAYRIADLPAGAGEGVASGALATRLVTHASANELLCGGGVQQARAIVGWVPARHEATVDAPFDPPLTGAERWRMRDRVGPVVAPPTGATRTFFWDSRDAGHSDEVLFRLFPIDTEVGATDDSGQPISFRDPLDVDPVEVPEEGFTDPHRVTLGDVDGDGDLDRVFVRGLPPTLVELQTTRGAFQAVALPDGFGDVLSRAKLGDVDGDGDLDLVTPGDLGLELLLQETPGVFAAAPLVLPYPDSPNEGGGVAEAAEVEVCDLDGDGDQDFVTANHTKLVEVPGPDETFTDSSLAVWLQEPAGTWTPVLLGGEVESLWPVELEVADLDEDGDLDFAVACMGCLPGAGPYPQGECMQTLPARTLVFWQTGAGAFDPAPTVVGELFLSQCLTGLTSGDLDGDGDRDLLTSHSGFLDGTSSCQGYTDDVLVHLQVAPGVFEDVSQVLPDPEVYTIDLSAPRLVHLDEDAHLDLLADTGTHLLAWYGRPDGSFEGPVARLSGGAGGAQGGTRERRPAGVDLEGDGDLDLVTTTGEIEHASAQYTEVALFARPGGLGPFSATPTSVGSPPATDNARWMTAVDLDGDGALDLVHVNFDANILFPDSRDTVTVHSQLGPRAFQLSAVLGGEEVTPGVAYALPGDLDGDGDLDLAVLSNFASSFAGWFRQVAPGTFDPAPQSFAYPEALGARDLVLGDLDGDGDLDAAALGEAAIHVALQATPGAYVPGADVPLPAGFRGLGLAVGDLDADGDDDLAALMDTADGSYEHWVFLALQTPAGLVAVPDPTAVPETQPGFISIFAQYLDLADLDQDGRGDLVLHCGPTTLPQVILMQTAPLAFTARVLDGTFYSNFRPQRTHSLGDHDQDGDLDLVQPIYGAVLEQVAPGWFWPHREPLVAGNSASRGAVVDDLDGDGAVDVGYSDFDELLLFWGGERE